MTPFLFSVAPITSLSTVLSIGMDSPVSIDSSTVVVPLMTFASTGIFSPGLTSNVSPT